MHCTIAKQLVGSLPWWEVLHRLLRPLPAGAAVGVRMLRKSSETYRTFSTTPLFSCFLDIIANCNTIQNKLYIFFRLLSNAFSSVVSQSVCGCSVRYFWQLFHSVSVRFLFVLLFFFIFSVFVYIVIVMAFVFGED